MYLDNLHIENFKNLKNIDLNFSKINLISGEAGNGKTAIMQDIILHLCNYVEGKLEDYVNWNNEGFKSILNFTHLTKKYEYKIKCGKNTDRELTTDNDVYYKSDSYKYIFDNILDPTLTLYSNISEQGKTASLLFESPTKSLEIIKKIFKIDSLNEKVELIKEEVRENNEKISIAEAERNVLDGRTFEFIDEPDLPDVDVAVLNSKLNSLEQDRIIYIEELKKYEVYKEQLKRYNESEIKLNELSKELKEVKESIKSIDVQEGDFDYDKLSELNSLLNEKEKNLIQEESKKNVIIRINNRINNIDKGYKNLQIQIDDLNIGRIPRCKNSNDDLSDTDKHINKLRIELNDVENKLKLAEKGKCPTCGTKFDSDISIINNFKESIEQLTDEIDKSNIIKNDIQRDIDNYNRKLKEYEIKKEKKNQIEFTLSDLKNEKDTLLEELKNYDMNLADIDKLESEIIDIKNNIESYENEKKSYENAINNLNNLKIKEEIIIEKISAHTVKKPNEFKFSVEFDENIYDSTRNDIQKYNSTLNERENIRKLNEKTKNDKSNTEKQIQEKIDNIYNLNNRNHLLKESQKIISKDFSAYIIDSRTKYINKKMNEFFQRSYNGRYQVKFEQDSKGIGFYYSDNNKDWHSTITLSGFERQLFSIGFRLALTTLQDVKILMLDEVDSDASTEKSLTLYRNLLNEKNIDQFFIITHNEETKELIRNYRECAEFCIIDGELI